MRTYITILPLLLGLVSAQYVAPSGSQSSPTTTPGGFGAPPSTVEGAFVAPTSASTTSGAPSTPSPTDGVNCVWHINHWDCEEESASSGECIIHVGHTHGDCSAQQLACGAILLQDYDMPLHIGSIFIVLVTSALGVLIPLVSGWAKRSDGSKIARGDPIAFGRGAGVWASIFYMAKHFGTGIIIATAFIHLLFHGFVMFQNECVGELAYESTAAAISMAAALITFFLDYIGTRIADKKSESRISSPGLNSVDGDVKERNQPFGVHDCGNVDAAFAAEESWRVILLEAGIIFHSIMIGVTLGASSGNGWTTLLIVIVFHQLFEGAALGARIALLYWISKIRAILMGLMFVLITPIGIAIGIGVRNVFSQNGKASLLSVGILNAISAGILLYTAFKLLACDFVDGPLRRASMGKVLAAMGSLVVGVIAMSVLGKWA